MKEGSACVIFLGNRENEARGGGEREEREGERERERERRKVVGVFSE